MGTFRGNILFCKFFFHHSRTSGKKLRPFVEKVSSGLSQLHPTCPYKYLDEESISVIFFNFPSFSDLERKILTFCREFFEAVDKRASCISSGTFRGNFLFCKNSNFFHHSRTRSKNTSAFSRKVFVGVVTTASHMSLGTFGGRMIFRENFDFSYRFRTLSEIFSTFFVQIFGWVCQNYILRVHGNT